MKSFRDIRVIPVVLVAIFGLAVLKVAGLVIDGGYVFDYQPAIDQEVLGAGDSEFPGQAGARGLTGSVDKPKEREEGGGAEARLDAPETKPEAS